MPRRSALARASRGVPQHGADEDESSIVAYENASKLLPSAKRNQIVVDADANAVADEDADADAAADTHADAAADTHADGATAAAACACVSAST